MCEIPKKESLTVEFKSDKKELPDSIILDVVVAFANTEGGDFYLGVEDDGTPTGVHPHHEDITRLGAFIANQGAEQCGFCNPGMIMNALALFRENPDPSEEEIKEYLAGNLCRCSGYEGQLRGIQQFLAYKKEKEGAVCR